MDISCSGECLQCHWLKTNCNAQGRQHPGSREDHSCVFGRFGVDARDVNSLLMVFNASFYCVSVDFMSGSCWLVTKKWVKTVYKCFTALISSIINSFLSYYTRFTLCQRRGSCDDIRRHAESGHGATERCELLSDSAGGVVYPSRGVGWKSKASSVRSLILYVWLSRYSRWFMGTFYCSAGFLSWGHKGHMGVGLGWVSANGRAALVLIDGFLCSLALIKTHNTKKHF